MANHSTKQGNEAHRPMGNSTVPVLFSLKNVQPLILNAAPSSKPKDRAPSAEIEKTSLSGHSAQPAVGLNPPALADSALLSRPTKVQFGSQILRTVGTVLLILLVILVVRMSVPVGTQDAKLATRKSPSDTSADSQQMPEVGENSTSKVSIPLLPALAANSTDLGPIGESSFLSPSKGLEIGFPGKEANPQLGSAIAERETSSGIELSSSPVPALLAAAPSQSGTVTSPDFPASLPSERQEAYRPIPSESNSSELLIQPYTNAPPSTAPPYTATRPEFRSSSDVRETSTPNLDNMEDLITLYRKGLGDGSTASVNTVVGGSLPARQVSASSSMPPAQPSSFAPQSPTPYIPTTPYAPLSTATNWPTSSIATPSSQVGGVRSDALPSTAPVNNNTLPMSGQSYPPPQRNYEPLTVPAYEQPSNSSGLSQNSTNRYQATLIRQPNEGSLAPITQPKLPYTPVGPTATGPISTGPTGSSFGYPPISVPSN